MNLSSLSEQFSTKEACMAHLEKLRWNGQLRCPKCNSHSLPTKRKKSHFYHCNNCNKDFSVLVGTIFEGSRLPLPKWFQIIFIMANAKKGIAAAEVGRAVGVTYKTAWYAAMRLRCAMIDESIDLSGILEMDEAYVGGKPGKLYISEADNDAILSKVEEERTKNKRGRGTKKVPIAGIAEKGSGGQVKTRVMKNLTRRNLYAMLKRYVSNPKETKVVTDGFSSYKKLGELVEEHISFVHDKKNPNGEGLKNTNRLDGFFSIIKNGIKGNYQAISKKYLPFYMVDFEYKYNSRGAGKGAFNRLLTRCVKMDKCLTKYQPTKPVEKIVYKRKPKKAN
jgi:transposase-like protein